MKISSAIPRSSFLSAEKDMNIIVDQMLYNERLKRLLYYTTPDCLNKDNLTEEQSLSLIGKNIKNVPKLKIDTEVLNYIIINFDNFTMNATNEQFRDNIIEFDILCHIDQWELKDFQLRPYKIAAEIDSMFNGKHLTGIGTLQFVGATQILLTNEYAGFCLTYMAIHGEEDKKGMGNPNDEAKFLEDFEARKEHALK